MKSRSVQKWSGLALSTVVVVATLWLAATNQLILYIHPRYVVFTVIMAVLALIVAVLALVLPTGHDHEEPATGWRKALSVSAMVLTVAIAAALIIVPPATLTSATAGQRELNSTSVGADAQTVDGASSQSAAAFAKFTVVDWASLLRQTSDTAFYASKGADVVGFITADEDDPQNVFWVSRFIITCCAVDAQPIGVPVYAPDWESNYELDGWVRVTGEFASNPSRDSSTAIALVPEKITKVETPDEPYLF